MVTLRHFRAADLGKDVILVERYDSLGGVCLNVGCIPSKALLHTAEIINEANSAEHLGIHFENPTIDIEGVPKKQRKYSYQVDRRHQGACKCKKS